MLDIPRESTDKEIRSAFLQLAKKYHPDVNSSPGAENIFSEINEAYETLSSTTKREIYDSTGMSSNEQQNYEQAGGGFGFNPFGYAFGKSKAAADMRSFEDILKEFEQFFNLDNEKGNTNGRLKARDVYIDLDIDFMEAIKGLTKQI